jgi:hypothetical protein
MLHLVGYTYDELTHKSPKSPNNIRKLQMGFNSEFKGLITNNAWSGDGIKGGQNLQTLYIIDDVVA